MLVNGVHLLHDVTGILAWPKERMLVVADLHFEKASPHAARGQRLPPHDSRTTLDLLASVLRQRQPRRVVCLGNSVRNADGSSRLSEREAEDLRKLVAAHDWLWITGSIDPKPEAFGGEVLEELTLGGLTFRHQPRPDAGPGEIAGHMHPQASIALPDGPRLTRPCFVTDGRRAILPAFGAHGGGLNVLDAAFRPLFRRGAFTALMLGDGKILTVPRAKLAGELQSGAHPEPGISARRVGSPNGGGRRMSLFNQD